MHCTGSTQPLLPGHGWQAWVTGSRHTRVLSAGLGAQAATSVIAPIAPAKVNACAMAARIRGLRRPHNRAIIATAPARRKITVPLLEPTVLYCDNHLLALDKPAGMPIQADASGDPDLHRWAKAWIGGQFHKPGAVFCGIVHRLDRPARGVVAMARTSKAAARLSRQFADRTAHKVYEAVVLGEVAGDAGDCGDWLTTGEGSTRVVAASHPDAQRAELAWQVTGRGTGRTLLQITLRTGRKHQIRAQWAHRGHPLLGDLRYGAPAPLPDRSIALWARELTVSHPTRPETLTFASTPPPGWPWQLEARLARR